MNKNWNDRADKDLFFTILSVKNIGVISGAEWTTIGNHMRSLGYGFTNEGCRQHFQGLRRAQHKTDSNGDSQRKSDPTENPITRRPGPGRGRPRKQPPAPVADSDQAPSSKPSSQINEDDLNDAAAAMDAIAVEETDSLSLAQDDSALDEQPAKRQRLESDDQSDDDAAVLALAADGLPGPDDHYDPPEYYGEA
ncbi:uncharacterized protein GGS22DRAFT_164285 [Annulohypoxylon maeteangense]|uniref:uncharacterized protein n=1 Tax=Annulohypoxylon maeteangense TaxID=1927788 RepID=UPI0020072695|nr:uncharacterized protein GGS22DRAFT_164285 [Annulohypoxylon maeteangense]KAI0884754.1 hypothetical protein GGS22DRAFT_164285 [Annulohypoxylon maeteangense]